MLSHSMLHILTLAITATNIASALALPTILDKIIRAPAAYLFPRHPDPGYTAGHDRYCPWCWNNITANQGPDNSTYCHAIAQTPSRMFDPTLDSEASHKVTTVAIVSNDLKDLYLWTLVHLNDTAQNADLPIDFQHPGTGNSPDAYASFWFSPNTNDTMMTKPPGFGYVWEGGGEDLSADFANDNWAWNTFNVTDDGSMNVHHVSFKCKQG